MCTRFYADLSPELRPYVEAANRSPLRARMVEQLGKPFKTEGEIRPTDLFTAIAFSRAGAPAAFPMVWGYTLPGLNRPVVNTRVETAPQKEIWRESWRSRRCVIPAAYYYEWAHLTRPDGRSVLGEKYMIQPRGQTCAFLAGLYRFEERRGFQYPVFSVLTREPSQALMAIHDRMPLILPPSLIEAWVRPENKPEELLGAAVTDLVFEKA